MTRKSKREIERTLEELDVDSDDDDGRLVVFEGTETGEWYDEPSSSGELLDQDEVDPTIVWRDEVVETGWEPTENTEADPR